MCLCLCVCVCVCICAGVILIPFPWWEEALKKKSSIQNPDKVILNFSKCGFLSCWFDLNVVNLKLLNDGFSFRIPLKKLELSSEF